MAGLARFNHGRTFKASFEYRSMIDNQLLLLCILCGAATAVLAAFAIPLCTKIGIMDVPEGRKLHRDATPLMGGLALTAAILPLSVAAAFMLTPEPMRLSVLIYIAATFAMAVLGMADDRHSLSARNRLLFSLLTFAIVSTLDPIFLVRMLGFAHLGFKIGMAHATIAVLFTTICCVGLANAINMADGKNGLVIGLSIGWLTMVAVRAPPFLQPFIALVVTGLAVLLIFNLRGRLFLGDGGSYGFACAIALLTIATYNSPGPFMLRAMPADEIMLLFAIPVIDSFRLTFVRLRRGQSPMEADRDHFHHHLQNKFGWPAGLILYWVIALAPLAAIYVSAIATIPVIAIVLATYIYVIFAADRDPTVIGSHAQPEKH